jgi:hypothetical protein
MLAEARAIVGHRANELGPDDGALARGLRTGAGPLDDGVLTRAELADLLHAVAVPSAPPFPARYAYEGFGALNDDTVDRAIAVLDGQAPMPQVNADDQSMHEFVEQWRATTTSSPRCTG